MNLLKIYKNFRDSDILEGIDVPILLAFLYFVKIGNLESKSFNPKYYKNTEDDVISERLKDLEKLYNLANGETHSLIKDFNDHPEWCKKEKSVKEFENFKLGQLVYELNNTLARIIHISENGIFRLALINEKGLEFAFSSAISEHLKSLKTDDNPVPSLDKLEEIIGDFLCSNLQHKVNGEDRLEMTEKLSKLILQNGVETNKEWPNYCGRYVTGEKCHVHDCDYPDCKGDNY